MNRQVTDGFVTSCIQLAVTVGLFLTASKHRFLRMHLPSWARKPSLYPRRFGSKLLISWLLLLASRGASAYEQGDFSSVEASLPPAPPTTTVQTADELHDAIARGGAHDLQLASTIDLEGRVLNISSRMDVTLRGGGIDARELSRVAEVRDGGRLVLIGVQITGGWAEDIGGCLLVESDGRLEVVGSWIEACRAQRGGGVGLRGGSVDLRGTTLRDVRAASLSGDIARGGGICAEGGFLAMAGVSMVNASVSHASNWATGGGISVWGYTRVNATNTSITNSTADGERGAVCDMNELPLSAKSVSETVYLCFHREGASSRSVRVCSIS